MSNVIDAPAWAVGQCVGPASAPYKYRIVEVVKGGGMSKVYKVLDDNLQKYWCYKEIITENNIDFHALLSEVLIMKKLDNPAIPRIVDIFNTNAPDKVDSYDARIGVIMDWVEGESLQNIIRVSGTIEAEMALQWAIQICKILEYLHKDTRHGEAGHSPILYRDLKPLNVIITNQGLVTLLDFGISIEMINSGALNDMPLGTPGYAPRELYLKDAPLDLRSDIYTIGATIYHMITGHVPPPAVNTDNSNAKVPTREPMSKYNPTISDELEAIIDKALAPLPEDRFDSVYEMRLELEKQVSVTDAMKEEAHKKIIICASCFISTLIFGMLFMVPFWRMQVDNNTNYESLVSVANSTKDPEDYKKAIANRPAVVEPYIGLIDAFEQDGVVTEDDLLALKDYLFPNRENMTDQDRYGELCFRVGELYWYYYDMQGSGTRPEVSAITWFEQASEAGYESKKADIYVKIGKFLEMQSKSVQMSSDKLGANLKEYWDNLLVSKSFITGDEELLQYQTYNSIAECIYNYSYHLLQNGVTEAEMKAEVKELQAFLQQVSGSLQLSTRSKQLYMDLKAKVPELMDKIKLASRGEG